MSSEFITIKISKDTFEQVKEYRDKNDLKSISVAIQNGLDSLTSQREIEEQKERIDYCEIQEAIVEKLIENTILNWLETVDEKKAVESINRALESFREIKNTLKELDSEKFVNKDEIIHEIFIKYITIINKTLDKAEIKNETKNRIAAIFLKQLLDYYESM